MEEEWAHRHPWHPDTPEWARHEFDHLFAILAAQSKQLRKIRELLQQQPNPKPGPPVTARLSFKLGEEVSMDLQITDAQVAPIPVSVVFLDASGQPATLNDVPQWASSDTTVASVDASADPTGLSAVVTPTGQEGATLVTVDTIDADGTDVKGAGTLTVIAGAAATAEITFQQAAPGA